MRKVFICILFTLFIPFQIDGMFRFWFDHKKSIDQANNLKVRANCLLEKNPSNFPLQNYLKSLESIEIDENNFHKVKPDLQTLLFIGNTHLYERLQSSALQNLPNFSWLRPWGQPIAQFSNVVQEVPAIVADTKDSLNCSDAVVAGCGFFIADSLVRRNSDNITLTLLAIPLYAIVPLTAVWLKKCSWDMNSILRKNSQFSQAQADTSTEALEKATLDQESLRQAYSLLQAQNHSHLAAVNQAYTEAEKQLQEEKASALRNQQETFNLQTRQWREEQKKLQQENQDLQKKLREKNVSDEIDEVPSQSSISRTDKKLAQICLNDYYKKHNALDSNSSTPYHNLNQTTSQENMLKVMQQLTGESNLSSNIYSVSTSYSPDSATFGRFCKRVSKFI